MLFLTHVCDMSSLFPRSVNHRSRSIRSKSVLGIFLTAARSRWWSSSLIDENRVKSERPCLQAPCLRQADDLACDGGLLARRKVVSQPRSLASRRHAVCKHGRMSRQCCHHQAPGTTTGTTHAAAVGCGVEPSVACATAPPKGTNSRLG